MIINLVLAKDFYHEMGKLPDTVNKKTNRIIAYIGENPFHPSTKYRVIEQAEKGIYATNVDDDYRLVWKKVESTVIICFVDKHDPAYLRAARLSITLEEGMVVVRDVLTINPPLQKEIGGLWATLRGNKPKGLFSDWSDNALIGAGVPVDLLPNIRALQEPLDLVSLDGSLPPDTYTQLASHVLTLIDRPAITPPPKEVEKSLKRYRGGQDLALFVTQEEFLQALKSPLEDWMLFIEPNQRRIVNRNYKGSARLKGVAGSGKTVVALHRTKTLTHQLIRYPEKERILLLTYGSRLPSIYQHLLQRLGQGDSQIDLIECRTIHSWAQSLVSKYSPRISTDAAKNHLYEAIAETEREFPGLEMWKWDKDFFSDEISYRIKGRDATQLETYLKLPNTGRGTPLRVQERKAAFAVYERYDQKMKASKIWDFDDLILEALRTADPNQHTYTYVGAVIDEVQDLTEAQLRLVRKMVIPGPNDLFLVGDGAQRIYKGGFSLSKLGIDIRGRGEILKRNYRNTQEIMQLASLLMQNIPIDDLDDEEATHLPDIEYSVRSGPIPTIRKCTTARHEIECIGEEIGHLIDHQGYQESDFAILYRIGTPYRELAKKILGVQYRITELGKGADSYFGTGLKLTTFHSAKGLEFKVVFIVGVSNALTPFFYKGRDGLTPEEITAHIEEERRLLYVALTRARDALYLSYPVKDEPSVFIQHLPAHILAPI